MEYRRLGRSGLKVAPICLGTMQFGWTADEPTSFQVMDAYAEAGGNLLAVLRGPTGKTRFHPRCALL